jgi:Protein of unknown function (DUF2802)
VELDIAFFSMCLRAVLILSAFIAFAWALRRMRLEFAEQLERVLASQEMARAETHALAEKLTALATLVAAIPARIEQRPVEAPPPPARPRREASPVRSYETARRLARNGATVEEIVATCGVAGTEARLLRRLHGGASERDNAA